MLKKLLLCASAAVLVASCTDEDVAFTAGTSEFYAVQPEDDLTFGYNSIITETDSLSTVSIPLNTDVAPVISCSDGVADLQCVNIDGKYYLQVANPEKAKLGVDEVTLTVKGHPELTKSFYFTVRKSYANTRALERTEQQDKIARRFANVFSVGQYIWKGNTEDHPKSPMFDSKVLYESLDEALPLFNVDDNYRKHDVYNETTGSTLEEHSQQYSGSVGLANIPVAGYVTGSAEYNRTEKSYSKHYYEYLTKSRSAYIASAKLSESMKATPAHDKYWKELITQELDNVLNNTNTKEYKKFPETLEGAYKIIDAYGSHLLTYCVLGTKATLEFRKKQDLNKTSVDWALSAKIQLTMNRPSLDSIRDKEKAAAAEYIDKAAASASGSFSSSYADLLDEMEASWDYTLVGGNSNTAKGIADWMPTEDPEKWIPVCYFEEGEEDEADLIAIYELCQDPKSPRCQTLKKALEEKGQSGYCHFIEHKMGDKLKPKDETEWVLAGVWCDVSVESDKDKDGNQTHLPKPFKMELPGHKGIKATFYPFTDLAFSTGNCLDTQTYDFGACHRTKCHYWYYAMMMRDDCPGLEEFILVEENKAQEYNQTKGYFKCIKGDEFGDGWRAGETGNYVLMCKPIKKGDTTTKPLTGFRLEAYDHYKDTDDDWTGKNTDKDEYRLLAVSAPTDPGLHGIDDNYKWYWQHHAFHGPKYKFEDIVKNVKDNDGKVRSVYHLQLIHQPWHLYLSTTNEPIRQTDLHVLHPTNMKN